MATIYKQADRPNWMIAWFDGTGRRRVRSAGTTDKRTAEQMAERLERDAVLEREGLRDPREDRFREGARTPLLQHVDAFCQHLLHKGNGEKHVTDRRGQLARLLDAMRVERVCELTLGRVQAALSTLRATRGIALRTLDRHVRAIKAFTRWLMLDGLLASDPLAALRGFNASTDRRRERRALQADEIARLVHAAETGGDYRGLSGVDRAMLYRLATGSGLRAAELASLRVQSFKLDADPPVIVVKAGYTKNGNEATQPIRRDLAERLRPWLAAKRTVGAQVFAVHQLPQKTASMMRHDLKRAGIPYIDEDGHHADFHALRHSYVTALVRSGATVKQAQVLARHSTPVLTLAVYSHVAMRELTNALEAMPGEPEAKGGRSVAG